MAVTPAGGEGTLDTWRCPCQCGGRPDKTGVTPMLAWTRGCGQTTEDGVYANQCLNLADEGKAHGRKPRFQTGPREIRLSGIIGGPPETWPWWKMRSRLAYRKSETGNPPPTAGAPELYPDRELRQFLNGHEEGNLGYKPRKSLRATAPALDPTEVKT